MNPPQPPAANPRRRVAFFGSPAWAVPVLEALHRHHQVLLVVTQPDKPAGRGLELTPCPVARRAAELGLRLEKPARLKKNAEFLEQLRALDLDVAVTAAYGKILPPELLELPRYGFLNLHPSDLPKYRGPAPVQWTLINGDTQTAVSIMRTDAGMDTGPIVSKFYTSVGPDETALELSERLRDKGIELLLEALGKLEHLALTPQPAQGTHAPMLEKEDGRIVWERPASAIYNRHRGVQPWPGSWFELPGGSASRLDTGGSASRLELPGKRVRVLSMRPVEGRGEVGVVLGVDSSGITVATGEGAILLQQVQPEGKKPMPAADWARGARIGVGSRLG
ncbi:methionyl-tRNA formyltransferase [Calidithermus roseus]|uniref:Methionyl-tRNA formyltransferase n=1 Tax=Calidithermus roseus TaxID=1644118 RepID=A0A399EL24_9DEIN|nr:methionyl-tRNA formyltransferase [Calidithermus roseus]RIH85307.1 Methionyl-tRNA formyltransferase [Calidithermus roseus]